MLARAAILVFATGCNLVFGIEDTDLTPPDLDGDGVVDGEDNCLFAENPYQEDDDGDAFGDACDRCRGLNTPSNHDEDDDRHGDACDVCPTIADFQTDADGDGTGEGCELDITKVTTEILFDPFEAIGPVWRSTGANWILTEEDSIYTSGPNDVDAGLYAPSALLSGNWYADVGVVARAPWTTGDRFGIGIVDPDGGYIVSCETICAASCELAIRQLAFETRQAAGPSLPVTRIRLIVRAGQFLSCSNGSSNVVEGILGAPMGALVIYGSPAIEITYVAAWIQR